MTDITDKSFTITGFLEDETKRFHETGHDITSVGHGVTQALDLDCHKIVIEVEIQTCTCKRFFSRSFSENPPCEDCGKPENQHKS